MHGILARGSHRMTVAESEQEAWDLIRNTVKIDLVFTELKLSGGGGQALIQRVKNDCLLKILPLVVYTEHGDRESVKRILELHVQNFLVKPYHDTDIYAEIKKATTNPWRARHFEEENSFCKQMGYSTAEYHKMLESLRTALEVIVPSLQQDGAIKAAPAAREKLAALTEQAEAAGAWGVVDCLNGLAAQATNDNWTGFLQDLDQLGFAGRLIFHQLNPNLIPAEFLTSQEVNAKQEEQARAVWLNAPAEGRCPMVDWERIQRELDALPGCPVIDSAAAAFQMAATGHPSCLGPLMDLAEQDPGLAAQMLIAANHIKRNEDADTTPLEDPRLAVGRLGELRLTTQASGLLTAEERLMLVPPFFDWPRFWQFQTGVAWMARYTCHYLEFYTMEPTAYMAGFLHDLGKLLLLRLHPHALRAILEYSRQQQIPLRAAERYFLGCTTAEIAAHFAEKQGMPTRFISVMRWIDSPGDAGADAELAAVVSFARDLCRHNNVGADGDLKKTHSVPIENTAEWQILRGSVFPSFNLHKFEQQVHSNCRDLKLKLHGRVAAHAVT